MDTDESATSGLAETYEAAWDEWVESGEDDRWNAVTGDGIGGCPAQ
jgi:hypothetical protein